MVRQTRLGMHTCSLSRYTMCLHSVWQAGATHTVRGRATEAQPTLLQDSDCGFRTPGISSAAPQIQLHNIPSVGPHLARLKTIILNLAGLVELQPLYERAVICLKAKVVVVSLGIKRVSTNVKRRRRAKVRIHIQIPKLKKLAAKQRRLGEKNPFSLETSSKSSPALQSMAKVEPSAQQATTEGFTFLSPTLLPSKGLWGTTKTKRKVRDAFESSTPPKCLSPH